MSDSRYPITVSTTSSNACVCLDGQKKQSAASQLTPSKLTKGLDIQPKADDVLYALRTVRLVDIDSNLGLHSSACVGSLQ